MDKSGFLRELQEHLIILSESEQKDILDEYTQHIDMKLENGMSETEAIRDFGDVKELASEILEAYHVDPLYRNKKRLKLVQKEDLAVQELKETGAHIWKSMVRGVKKLCFRVWSAVKVAFLFMAAPFAAAWNALKCRKEAAKELRSSHLEADYMTGINAGGELSGLQRNVTAGKLIGRAGYGMNRFMSAIVQFIAACVRWFWNGCVIAASLVTGAMTLFGIFCMGVIVILLLQGYPLLGAAIASLGGVMCAGSATLIISCLFRRKNMENRQQTAAEAEVQEVSQHA